MYSQNQNEVMGIFVGKELMRKMEEMPFGANMSQLLSGLRDSEIL